MTLDSWKNTQEKEFKIEDAKPEDVEAIRAIVIDAWLEIYPNEKYGITREDIAAIDWREANETRRQKIREGKDDNHTWVLKDNNGSIVGFCAASRNGHRTDTEGQKEIDAMYVVKKLQGTGQGKKLMQKALEWLGTDSDIRLEVVSYNTNAISFYKSFGFQETTNPVSEGKRTQLPSGKQIPRIVMVRLHDENHP